MFTQFRIRYPQGSLITELVTIECGKYVVRTLVQAEGITLATGLAAADTVEQAEDRARERALLALNLDGASAIPTEVKPPVASATPSPDVSTKPKISASSDGQKELAYPVAPKQEVAPVMTTSDRQQDVADEPPDTSSARETLNSEVSEPSSRDESLTPLFAEIKTEDLIEQELPVKPTESEDLTVEQLSLSDATETVPAETLSPATAVSEDKVAEVAARGGKPLITPTEPLDFSDIIAKSNVEIKRLGWTNEQGKQYLLQTYGKRSRQLLSDEELLEFLHYLESQPTP